MKVLFISTAYPSSSEDARGIFVHRISRALVAQGTEVVVVAPSAPGLPKRHSLDGVEVLRATYWLPRYQTLATGLGGIVPNIQTSSWLALQAPLLLGALTRAALRMAGSVDIVHAHWVFPSGLAGVAASRRHRVPLVVTSRGGDAALARRLAPFRWIFGWVARHADACIGVSHDVCDVFRRVGAPNERVLQISSGVDDVTAEMGSQAPTSGPYGEFADSGGLRLLYVGSLIPRKSVRTLLEAHELLQRSGVDVHTAIVGAGPEAAGLRRSAAEKGLRNVHFESPQPPSVISEWMSAADAVVLPSLSEGRPTVAVEALAHERPVLATRIPGTIETVRDGETGFLFPPRDAHALAAAAKRLLDPGVRKRLGQAGRGFVLAEGLYASALAARHRSLYESLVDSRVTCRS